MTKSILKSIAVGALFGATLFFMPKILLGIVIVLFVVRLMFGWKYHHGRYEQYRLLILDRVRSMTDEEYAGFKTQMVENRCHCHCAHKPKANNKTESPNTL